MLKRTACHAGIVERSRLTSERVGSPMRRSSDLLTSSSHSDQQHRCQAHCLKPDLTDARPAFSRRAMAIALLAVFLRAPVMRLLGVQGPAAPGGRGGRRPDPVHLLRAVPASPEKHRSSRKTMVSEARLLEDLKLLVGPNRVRSHLFGAAGTRCGPPCGTVVGHEGDAGRLAGSGPGEETKPNAQRHCAGKRVPGYRHRPGRRQRSPAAAGACRKTCSPSTSIARGGKRRCR